MSGAYPIDEGSLTKLYLTSLSLFGFRHGLKMRLTNEGVVFDGLIEDANNPVYQEFIAIESRFAVLAMNFK